MDRRPYCGARDGALQCVLVFRRAVDRVVVHACGDGADPHSHGALG